ncbi:YheC/YheD family protein [Aneurinibacillus uraniidurans]|uniref:YheC/YheD family endospore coat-associated protein n=1 Tax=Aneurinibacillus uraniidurans TaxID=2966586 RepID=UPI00234BFF62|nr:YheC/YheD family protein [Aneurinibacillus sp. B1]WCN37261.1 YheC/YheD family protein [Aneurinibacillus sp. B1]
MSQLLTRVQRVSDQQLPQKIDGLFPESIARQYGLRGSQTYEVVYGLARTRMTLAPGTTSLTFKESAAHPLHLSFGTAKLGLRFEPDEKRFVIGPLVGVLIAGMSPGPEGPFGNITDFCREVSQTCRARGGIGFVYTLSQVSAETNKLEGWMYRDGRWVKQVFPLPYCSYNRIGSRRVERKEETQTRLHLLKQKGGLFFNEQFLDKWMIHQKLAENPDASRLLPHTTIYNGASSLQAMLTRHSYVYMKPSSGSLGRGIIRITQQNGEYICQYETINGAATRRFRTFAALHQMLKPRLTGRLYLVQQGLHLIRSHGGLVDFRALVQKDRTGKWAITSIVGRTGTRQSIVSNVARGGTMLPLTRALVASTLPTSMQVAVAGTIRRQALAVARLFEQSIGGHYAELGIDIAVERTGRVWLLEVNSKPSKTNDAVASPTRSPRPSVTRIVDYCFYRNGFAVQARKKKRRSTQ